MPTSASARLATSAPTPFDTRAALLLRLRLLAAWRLCDRAHPRFPPRFIIPGLTHRGVARRLLRHPPHLRLAAACGAVAACGCAGSSQSWGRRITWHRRLSACRPCKNCRYTTTNLAAAAAAAATARAPSRTVTMAWPLTCGPPGSSCMLCSQALCRLRGTQRAAPGT